MQYFSVMLFMVLISIYMNETVHLLYFITFYLSLWRALIYVTFSLPPVFGGCQCITMVRKRY